MRTYNLKKYHPKIVGNLTDIKNTGPETFFCIPVLSLFQVDTSPSKIYEAGIFSWKKTLGMAAQEIKVISGANV